MLRNPEDIEEVLIDFFRNLFCGGNQHRPVLEGLDMPKLDNENMKMLEGNFSMEEIRDATFSFSKEKAPGIDGFSIDFFQDCWEIIKDDLFQVVSEFFRNGVINLKTNNTLICLIPKKNDAIKVGDFRLISLTTGLYRIISKMLA